MGRKPTCYYCIAYDKDPVYRIPICLVGEQQIIEKFYYNGACLYKARPVRPYCKCKNIKDYVIRAEKQIKRMTIK